MTSAESHHGHVVNSVKENLQNELITALYDDEVVC